MSYFLSFWEAFSFYFLTIERKEKNFLRIEEVEKFVLRTLTPRKRRIGPCLPLASLPAFWLWPIWIKDKLRKKGNNLIANELEEDRTLEKEKE